jgi:hypothetical protein
VFPKGPNSFKSFPDRSNVVGGAMVAAGLGDPCLPFKGEYDDVGGDRDTLAMTELFRVCHTGFGDKWVLKKPDRGLDVPVLVDNPTVLG